MEKQKREPKKLIKFIHFVSFTSFHRHVGCSALSFAAIAVWVLHDTLAHSTRTISIILLAAFDSIRRWPFRSAKVSMETKIGRPFSTAQTMILLRMHFIPGPRSGNGCSFLEFWYLGLRTTISLFRYSDRMRISFGKTNKSRSQLMEWFSFGNAPN